MRADPVLYVRGLGRYLPEPTPLDRVLIGYSVEEQARARATGYSHLAIEPELYPAAMALHAAREALQDAGVATSDVALVATSAIHRHGHKHLWSLASWLQSQLSVPAALPFNIQQGCNGNLIALQLACTQLPALGSGACGLIVASDRFGASLFDRVAADYGVLYGDAASAVVLSQECGRLRVCGIATESLAFAEAMHRGLIEQPESLSALRAEHDVRDSKRRFLAQHGRDGFAQACCAALERIKRKLLADRGVEHIVFPNVGRELLEANYYPAFADAEAKSLWPFARTVGHLGTGDAIVGLYELAQRGQLHAGRRVLLIGAGAGFTLSGAVLEVCS